MRSRQFLALVLAFTLSSVTAAAAPRSDDHDPGRVIPGIEKVIKRIAKFFLHPLDELTLPHP